MVWENQFLISKWVFTSGLWGGSEKTDQCAQHEPLEQAHGAQRRWCTETHLELGWKEEDLRSTLGSTASYSVLLDRLFNPSEYYTVWFKRQNINESALETIWILCLTKKLCPLRANRKFSHRCVILS